MFNLTFFSVSDVKSHQYNAGVGIETSSGVSTSLRCRYTGYAMPHKSNLGYLYQVSQARPEWLFIVTNFLLA